MLLGHRHRLSLAQVGRWLEPEYNDLSPDTILATVDASQMRSTT